MRVRLKSVTLVNGRAVRGGASFTQFDLIDKSELPWGESGGARADQWAVPKRETLQ